MKIRDGVALWNDIRLYKLDDKRIGEMRLHEVELLADLLSKHVENDVAPHFDGDHLVIPFGAPLACRWWQRNMTDKERYDLYLSLGVPEDRLTRYMSPRAISVARGEVDVYGKAKNGKEKQP